MKITYFVHNIKTIFELLINYTKYVVSFDIKCYCKKWCYFSVDFRKKVTDGVMDVHVDLVGMLTKYIGFIRNIL